jgi:quercetin dioxygenase-like cupin family protein
MKRPLAVLAAVIAAILSAGVAAATPPLGVVTVTVAKANEVAINTTQGAGNDAVIQNITFAPGGYTGWHTHPGVTVVLVTAGTITLYNHACQGDDHAAGEGFIEQPGVLALARNNTGAPAAVTVVYFNVPVGGAVRTDADAPACADAGNHDLPTTAAAAGLVPAVLNRANFATAADVVNAAGNDVVVVQNTIAAGGHSGWHSHTGAAVVTVKSGTLKLYNAATCTARTFGPGQGWIEEPTDVQIGRNEGTVPLVLYVAFFDVPVGGSNRIDKPEPANCTGLSPTSLAAPVASAPNTAALAAPGPTSPAPPLAFLLIALVACLGAIGVSRRRQRS